MIRILQIFDSMANGGIEHFVMEYYRHMDREKIQFDFLVSTYEKGYFDDEILRLGGKIYHACPKRKNLLKNFFDIERIVKENHFTIVHRHTGSAVAKIDLLAAKLGGAQHLILHSHNNSVGRPWLHKMAQVAFAGVKTHNLACSQEAGKFLFGESQEFTVIRNAIDCGSFRFDPKVRAAVRSRLGWDGHFVIGHVGRFSDQKNHGFLLEILQAYREIDSAAKLVCVGSGENVDAVKQRAAALGVAESVVFLGNRTDVNELLQGFDVFVLPSLYEGLPYVLVEAQASGLPCVVSTNVPKESDLTGRMEFIGLNAGLAAWTSAIQNCGKAETKRENAWQTVRDARFDIFSSDGLVHYYQKLTGGR